jgi:nitroreductase
MDIEAFLKLSSSRLSCRSYSPAPVGDEAIAKCLEAARLAPSACNKQPWRFVVVRDAAKREAIASKALLPGLPMPWLKKAPVIVALCSQRSVETHWLAPLLSGVSYDLLDVGIAGEHFVLAAEAQGLGTCWIGWFRPGPLKKILGIPRSVKPLSLISLGYPERRGEPMKRKALDEIAFSDSWGSPFKS